MYYWRARLAPVLDVARILVGGDETLGRIPRIATLASPISKDCGENLRDGAGNGKTFCWP